ncbi:serine/threonine-protein phosphatase 4 regulatory subunit 4-like [Centruroides sculpturatus]|uniref:serine/threonine-protein phosphatase 4 regulatory subunit 4-like n=1 Tax=Centruroides sculpturatus TaxID=218467 RepID=UPI000C6D9D6B|nr:serine/threonine-protein phosphatase 4 regulatory subunit 4-like [Centruroides sculpturatus]
MWLADDKSSHQKESVVDSKQHDPSSPPLEGGESLCEFYLEGSDEDQKLKILHGHSEHVENKHVDNIRQRFEEEAFYLHNDHLNNSNTFLSSLLSQELVPSNTFTHSFLQSILSSVDSRDPVVANAWMETLLDVIDLLPKDIIKRDILTLAINKGQISQPVSSRLLCCKMLGKICTKFDPYIIRKEILPVVQSLCQDVDHEVRGCMCRQLDVVAKGIGLEATKSAILPELVELANDEESYVRLTGIETVVQMLPMLDDETCIQIIIPLVKKFCENSIRTEDATLPVIARHLGKLCHGLAVNLTPDQQQWFLTYYRELAKLGLPHHRKSFDGGFISVPPVLRGLIPHLPESLAAVTRHLGDNNETKEEIGELLHALVICENATSLTSNWRLHADILTQLSCLPHCLPSEQIYSTFVPLLFNKIHTARPIPCRVAAAYSLLVYLRNTPQFEQRNDIINRLIDELCQGRSCHSRMLFIRVCELVMELFSKSFFKQYFFRPLLKLAEDPVPNVRLRLCSVLPQLKAQIKLPTDGSLLQELEACVRVLMTDEGDRDVAAAVRNVIEELDKIEVAMEPVTNDC